MPRKTLLILAGVLALFAVGVGVRYLIQPKAILKITTGHQGGAASRFVNALAASTAKNYPRVRLEPLATEDLAASARAIENLDADLAVVRTDASPPANGETIVNLRRDALAIVTPAKTEIQRLPDLSQKTIGIPQSYLQSFNERALDMALAYYDVPEKSVRRLFLPMEEIGRALAEKRIAAVLAIGPTGPGEVADVVTAVKNATKATPKILAIEEAKAISRRIPAFEAIEVPTGAFKGQPAVPDESVPTIAVSYRLVAPDSMLDIVAGVIAHTILSSKAKLVQTSPFAAQIEAPDVDDKRALLPAHAGVVAYLEKGERSFFDEFRSYFEFGGLALSALGSLAALLFERLKRRKAQGELLKIDRLIGISDEALKAQDEVGLDALEHELNALISWFIKNSSDADSSALTLAISHARYAIGKQRDWLSRQGAKSLT